MALAVCLVEQWRARHAAATLDVLLVVVAIGIFALTFKRASKQASGPQPVVREVEEKQPLSPPRG